MRTPWTTVDGAELVLEKVGDPFDKERGDQFRSENRDPLFVRFHGKLVRHLETPGYNKTDNVVPAEFFDNTLAVFVGEGSQVGDLRVAENLHPVRVEAYHPPRYDESELLNLLIIAFLLRPAAPETSSKPRSYSMSPRSSCTVIPFIFLSLYVTESSCLPQ